MKHQEFGIGRFARPCYATISPEAPAMLALSVMKKAGLHYLPVQKGKRVIGILSDGRLRTGLTRYATAEALVSDLMFRQPTVVSPDTSLYQVLDETADSVLGVTVVQDISGNVTGIFTPLDAISAYERILKS